MIRSYVQNTSSILVSKCQSHVSWPEGRANCKFVDRCDESDDEEADGDERRVDQVPTPMKRYRPC